MTEKETVQVMAMLEGFYGMGKGNPEIMAAAWHLVLKDYDFEITSKAVIEYAKNDTREYASFPTVGNIVKCIEDEKRKEVAPINEVTRAISYGWHYDQLSKEAQANITEEHYNDWLKMDAEEFQTKANILAGTLKKKQQKRLAE